MKKIFTALLCISLILLSGCTQGVEDNKKNIIATSFYPVYIFTLNLTDGIDELDVRCMAEQNTGCLHDYTITSKDARLLNDCSVFVINGAGMEGFIEDLYTAVDDLDIIDSSVGTKLICAENHHHHHSENGVEITHSSHASFNSHIWMSVSNAQIQVKNIAAGLTKAFPEYEEEINANLNEYSERLHKLTTEMKAASALIEGKNVIAFHSAYGYLAEEMGFMVSHTIESDENGEPSAQKLMLLTKEIKKDNIKALLVEPSYSGSAAEILKNETGIQVYTLNPVLTGEKNKTAYEDIMKENIEILKAVK